ncbi:MAG: STAS domain-containing protein [SAR324 cluster bacterium]|nr:STAS domain-containing protein [SAR324 cluster bacterium]
MIEVEHEGIVCKIVVLDHFSLDDVHDVIEDVESAHARKVLIDLSQIEVMTSSNIGLLVAMYNNLKEINVGMSLCNLTAKNRHLVSIAKLDTLFSVFDTVDAGVSALNQ